MKLSNFPTRKIATPDSWGSFVEVFRRGQQPLAQNWGELFGPIRDGTIDDIVIVGQLGQSLDGRLATATGHSKYINCAAGIEHLHRLRSLVDVVVVGVGTAIADNPQLTVRQVTGPQPARAVIDPGRRLGEDARLFADDGVRRLLIAAEGSSTTAPPGVEVITLPAQDGNIPPCEIASALRKAGMRRILIEGGADTLSRFISARCLDRLHVTVAPVMLGAGGPSMELPSLQRADQAYRMPTRVHRIEDDVLFDCDLSGQRVVLGVARKST